MIDGTRPMYQFHNRSFLQATETVVVDVALVVAMDVACK
jgi:hypothetical protein